MVKKLINFFKRNKNKKESSEYYFMVTYEASGKNGERGNGIQTVHIITTIELPFGFKNEDRVDVGKIINSLHETGLSIYNVQVFETDKQTYNDLNSRIDKQRIDDKEDTTDETVTTIANVTM